MYVDITCASYIFPTLDIIGLEHRVTEEDLICIIKQSVILPPGRELLFSKGLIAGFNNDYITALHILIPQVEHFVRYHLKMAGEKTSTLDSNGIETENGLSTLIQKETVKKIFGEDLAFELEVLFCDSRGLNLRNNIAHGLIDQAICNSRYGIYAWYLILKIVIQGYQIGKNLEHKKSDGN